jgi:hypothetical protein
MGAGAEGALGRGWEIAESAAARDQPALRERARSGPEPVAQRLRSARRRAGWQAGEGGAGPA